MRALLKKDAGWLLAFAVLGVGLHLWAMIAHGSRGVWVRPDDDYTWATFTLLSITAAVFGAFSVVHEELRRTREYLVHRQVTFRAIFIARNVGCAVVLLSWILLPLVLHYAGSWLFSPNRPVLDGSRFWPYVKVYLAILPAFAAGCYAATLSRRLWVVVLFGAAMVTAVCGIFALGLATAHGFLQLSPWLFRTSGVLGIAVLLAGAYHGERRGTDEDMPWTTRRLGLVAAPLVLMLGVGFTLWMHVTQHEAQKELFGEYPVVGRTPDGHIGLFVGKPMPVTSPWMVVEVGGRHEQLPTAVPIRVDEYSALWRPHRHRALEEDKETKFSGNGSFLRRRMDKFPCGYSNECFLSRAEGLLNVVQYEGGGRPDEDIYWLKLGKGAAGVPFSQNARVLGSRYGQRTTIVVLEPDEGTLWSHRLGDRTDRMARVELPGGDRFVRVADEPRLSRPEDWYAPGGDRAAVYGERGVYDWLEGRFVPASPARLEALAHEQRLLEDEKRSPAVGSASTPLGHTVEVPDGAGRTAFRHTFAPRTLLERALAASIVVPSLLRPPALETIAALAPRKHGDAFTPYFLLDPLPGAPGFGWVLAGNLALGAGLSLLSLRRLRKLGATRSHQLFWTIAVGLVGPIGFVCYRTFETRRAWHPIKVAAKPEPEAAPAPPPLLIASA